MALVDRGIVWGGSTRELSDESIYERIGQLERERGKGISRLSATPYPSNPATLTRIGGEWLKQNNYKNWNDTQAKMMGYKVSLWDQVNDFPRKPFPAFTPLMNPDGTPQPEPDHIAKLRKAHKETTSRLTRDRAEALNAFATTGVPGEEEGLGLTKADPVEIDKEKDAEEYTNKLLDRVRGKGLVEYTQPPAPKGMHWELVREKGKPRGLPFRKGKDARRWTGGNPG
jgi:hypothetical protein